MDGLATKYKHHTEADYTHTTKEDEGNINISVIL